MNQILDEYGRPIRSTVLSVPQWMKDQLEDYAKRKQAERRVAALHASVEAPSDRFDIRGAQVGQTIYVKAPAKYRR